MTKFDEKENRDFTMKCFLCMGLCFIGLDKHTWLRVHQIKFSYFKQGHEFEGRIYVKSTHLNKKSTKLSFTKERVHGAKLDMRLSVDPNNLSCPGGTIFRHVHTLPPRADRFTHNRQA